MKKRIYMFLLLMASLNSQNVVAQKIFDTHIHGENDIKIQLDQLTNAGIYKAAISSSWQLQSSYKSGEDLTILQGLMLPCPEGKVPYSRQLCFENKEDLPDLIWVEDLIIDKRIDFIGEVLSQYYGISPSDNILHPYYSLAERYGIPVGIHTGLAGPDHGSPNFKVGLGDPILLEEIFQKFPKLKIWIMHAGAPFIENTIAIMSYYRNVYTDISVISNPEIFPVMDFRFIMRRLIDAGLEDRLMFGSDNGDINKIITNVKALEFLNGEQKDKIFYKNAEVFFTRSRN